MVVWDALTTKRKLAQDWPNQLNANKANFDYLVTNLSQVSITTCNIIHYLFIHLNLNHGERVKLINTTKLALISKTLSKRQHNIVPAGKAHYLYHRDWHSSFYWSPHLLHCNGPPQWHQEPLVHSDRIEFSHLYLHWLPVYTMWHTFCMSMTVIVSHNSFWLYRITYCTKLQVIHSTCIHIYTVYINTKSCLLLAFIWQ